MKSVPAAAFTQVATRWLAEFENTEKAVAVLCANSKMSADGWRKRLTIGPNCWLGRKLSVEQVDEFLTAADATHLWHEAPLARKRKALVCEDCGDELGPDNYMPLDLFRPQSGSSGKFVWDSTKQKWARRPAQGPRKRAKRNGRRFRSYDLCRRCAGQALRQRATKERVAPKRGGRPRLLTDGELRTLHRLYQTSGASRREIAGRLAATREKGTHSGFDQALLYGWRRLGLELRDRSTQIGISRHGTDGTKSKRNWKQQCQVTLRNGNRCTQWVRVVREETSSHPAEDGLCWNHAHCKR